MTDSWKARVLAAVTSLVVGCGGTTDTSSANLTGTWVAAPGVLGIATMDLVLTELNSEISGTGTYVGAGAGVANGTTTVTGIHIATELNMTINFTPEGGQTVVQNLTGHVDDADHFVLVFPGENATRVTFTRK